MEILIPELALRNYTPPPTSVRTAPYEDFETWLRQAPRVRSGRVFCRVSVSPSNMASFLRFLAYMKGLDEPDRAVRKARKIALRNARQAGKTPDPEDQLGAPMDMEDWRG